MITVGSDPFSASGAQQHSAKPDDEIQRESEYSRTEYPNASRGSGHHDSPSEAFPPFANSNQAPAFDNSIYGGVLTGSALFADELDVTEDSGRAPSLPVILISAACGIAGGVIGLYISYTLLDLGTVLSAGLGTLGLLFGLGASGAALSAATGERGAVTNMVFSCTLILLMMLFLALCAVVGAAVATLFISL